jgi:hypothetical protein
MRWPAWQVIKHQYFDALTIVGLRDRLRCPKCSAVGTYKPHGGWCDLFNEWRTNFELKLLPGVVRATSRRWMCKYCGYCRDEHGEHYGAPNGKKLVWDLVGPDSHPTPKEAVEKLCGKTWPWRG